MEGLQTVTKLITNVTKIKMLNKLSQEIFVCPNAVFSDIISLIFFFFFFLGTCCS